MLYGPPTPSSTEEAEYYFQELRAQRLRAEQLFYGDVSEDDPLDDPYDDFYPYDEEAAR